MGTIREHLQPDFSTSTQSRIYVLILVIVSGLLMHPVWGSDQVDSLGAEGLRFTAKIAAGEPVGIDVPWMASLRQARSSQVFCGAMLVAPQYLITAAHCVAGFDAQDFVIRFENDPTDTDRLVDRYWISADFRWSHLDNDIAFIRLQSPQMDLPLLPLANTPDVNNLQDGERVRILGYGQTRVDGALSDTLKEGIVPFVSSQTCSQQWQTLFPSLAVLIENQGVCASGFGFAIDTCLGDSGGPLLLERDGFTLLGLTSFGEEGCGSAQRPSVYARVDHVSDQILPRVLRSEAYYARWTQTLVGDNPALEPISVTIENETELNWILENVVPGDRDFGEPESFQYSADRSTCGTQLLPGASCAITFLYDPSRAGFSARRFLLKRDGLVPIWVDLQGFAFEYVPTQQFDGELLFGFVGGEAAVSQITGEDGYIEWSGLRALDFGELYISSEREISAQLLIDHEPLGDEPAPIIELRTLEPPGESRRLVLDRSPGWQQISLDVVPDQFWYLTVQAPGQGLPGRLKVDLSRSSADVFPELIAGTPGDVAASQVRARDVELDQGGAADWWFIAMVAVVLSVQRVARSDRDGARRVQNN